MIVKWHRVLWTITNCLCQKHSLKYARNIRSSFLKKVFWKIKVNIQVNIKENIHDGAFFARILGYEAKTKWEQFCFSVQLDYQSCCKFCLLVLLNISSGFALFSIFDSFSFHIFPASLLEKISFINISQWFWPNIW